MARLGAFAIGGTVSVIDCRVKATKQGNIPPRG